ncbi:hypothetical protein QWM81_02360 [Streptomyces ficellus]|uniref:DUF4403 family protein n=1 Tax=Streptomyces ficellus TaxID=1977088 RepID=A0ABT7Z081_9ACTN|nr:hypothetical protein [Streptomyces ficellus]MDN3292907.1 hypothetical protein [Streptomyces ficellus]
MKNTDIFSSYDMVVSIKEDVINQQLIDLQNLDDAERCIPSRLAVVAQHAEDGSTTYQILEGDAQPPEISSNPKENTFSYIDGTFEPSIYIPKSGGEVSFRMTFRGGNAALWSGPIWAPKLDTYSMAGWKYGVGVNLDLQNLGEDGVRKLPQPVADQLSKFTDDMFQVRHLFVDFQTAQLINWDPDFTIVQGSKDAGLTTQFATLLGGYLRQMKSANNPYVLGYAPPGTALKTSGNVPDGLLPTGTTFTMYHDKRDPTLNAVNFVLVTKLRGKKISGSPQIFDTSWLTGKEQGGARMTVGFADLVEPLILKPVYDGLRTQIHQQLSGHVNVEEGNEYKDGIKATGTGYSFTISDVTTGDDQYKNTFDVSFKQDSGKAVVSLSGTVMAYKETTKHELTCTAKTWHTVTVDWNGTVTLAPPEKDAEGRPTITVSHDFSHTVKNEPGSNDCANSYKWIDLFAEAMNPLAMAIDALMGGDILKSILDDVPEIGDLQTAMATFGDTISGTVVLPAGRVFSFGAVDIDGQGNVSLELTYKGEH